MNRRGRLGRILVPTISSVLLLVLLAGPARAATACEDLLRLVPDDVGFCLAIQNLREHAAAFADSPFLAQLGAAPLGRAVRGSVEVRKLGNLAKILKEHLGVSWNELRDDILGDALVLAYRPSPPGKADQDQGLLLLRARDPQLLAKLIARLNDAQKQAGDIQQIDERDHNGTKYMRRLKNRDGGAEFYYLHGPVLAYSTQEDVVRQVIDRNRAAQRSAEKRSYVAEQFRQLIPAQGLAGLWINPRAFDAELQEKTRTAQGAEAVFLKNFQHYWKSLEGLALSVRVEKDLELALAVRARAEGLPPAARRFLAAAAAPSELWNAFPPDALLAVAGRLDLAALFEMLGEFMTDDVRKGIRTALDQGANAALGRDIFTEVLPLLGPDWGLCITAPSADRKGWFPHIIAALRVQPSDKYPPLDQALLASLNSVAIVGVLDHNSKHKDKVALRSVMQDKVEVKYLAHDSAFPPGLQPAFALKHSYLVLASAPEALRRFTAAGAGPPSPGADVPLLRISLQALRTYLKDRREGLIAYVNEKKSMSREEVARQLDGFIAGLGLFDRVELSQRGEPGQLTLVLRLRTAQPLRQ